MIFKFPKKKIVLDCFTYYDHILTTAPIVPAMKLIPEWWKNLPNYFYDEHSKTERSTMRHCAGMVDYYKTSIVIPLWSDLLIDIKSCNQYKWSYSDGMSRAFNHDITNQATGFLNNYAHIKLETPWVFKTKENIKWVWSHPTYSFPNSHNIVSLPGVVNYFEQRSTNINLLFFAEKEIKILIPQNHPMVHITPMSDRKVEIVRHLISKQEFGRLSSAATDITFKQKYETIKKRQKQFENCPYHNKT